MVSRFGAVAVALACAAVLAVPAASAGRAAAPRPWAAGFCGSVLTWAQTAKASGASLEKIATSTRGGMMLNLPRIRSQFVAALDRIAVATDRLRSRLHALGAPSVPHGAEIQAQVEAAFARLAARFHGTVTSARKLPIGNPLAFSKAAVALGKSVSDATNGLGAALSALDKYKEPALDRAAASVAACKKLG